MKRYFRYAFLALGVFFCALIYFTCIKRTKGFSYHKIHSHYGYDPRWDFGAPNSDQEILLNKIATQPFTQLGSGKECYAFVSKDGKIVVKFFKQKHMRTKYLLSYFPLPQPLKLIQEETINRHRERRKKLYQSYQIAYERLPEETGVLYLHLTKTNHIRRPIHLFLKSGKKLTLKLDDMEFLVQKRATKVFDYLTAHPEKGKEVIDALLNHITTRREKGIGDSDINCERNLGLYKGKALQVDLGELFFALPSLPSKKELIVATLDLKHYLEQNLPSLVPYLDKEIDRRS